MMHKEKKKGSCRTLPRVPSSTATVLPVSHRLVVVGKSINSAAPPTERATNERLRGLPSPPSVCSAARDMLVVLKKPASSPSPLD